MYTQGPWAWFRGSLVTSRQNGDIGVDSRCVMYNKDGALEEPNEFDANLIAAAPEIYETARALVDGIMVNQTPLAFLQHKVEALLKALNKAEGMKNEDKTKSV